MAQTLPEVEYQEILDLLPDHYVEGLVAQDKQFDVEKARLAANHPKRIKMFDRVEDLPWIDHWSLLRSAARATSPTGLITDRDISWHSDTPAEERAAILAEAAAMMQLLTVLFLLSMAGRHKYPGALLLVLLWALGVLPLVPNPVVPPSTTARPMRVLRPPGRLVVAGPRVARAPGVAGPLVVHRSEGHAGLCAFRGNAVVA
jgi:hypothetical protein